MSELQKFHDELMADVIAEVSSAGSYGGRTESAFKESAFTRILLADLEAAGVVESPVECYFANTTARLPYKVNGYSLPAEESTLDLVIADFRSDSAVQKLTGAEIDRAFKHALRFLAIATERGSEVADSGHEEHAMLREIFEKKQHFDRVQLILITNAQVVQRKEKERRDASEGYQIGYEIWDLERLRRFRSSGATHERVNVDFRELPGGGIRCVPAVDAQLGYRTCVAIVPGSVLFEIYEEYGARLLELNVRSYLQAKGKINKEILETLLLKPQLFLAYNNGITIVAEQVGLDDTGTLITEINGFQIVNGGQTTASIHRAHKESKADLTHVFVQAKVTVVPAEQFDVMVPEISRLSNTQNKVTTVDLGANHPFHIGVERVSRKTWAPGEQSMWFYERARGAFQTERTRIGTTQAKRVVFDRRYPTSQRVTKEELARYSNTWGGLPHVVSKGGQKSFERFMASLPSVEKGWEPEQDEFKALIGRAILFRRTQDLAKKHGIKAYAINIVAYTVALLAERTLRRVDLKALWDWQNLTPALATELFNWLPRVASLLITSAGDRNTGEWFKSEQCWRQLKDDATSWSVSRELAAELLSVSDEYDNGSTEVQNNIARCLQVSPETWVKIQIWGNESDRLTFWQKGIANTLAGYAAAGWRKKPSEKQARHAVAMLDLYERAH